MDKWDRKTDFGCDSCMFYVPKVEHSKGKTEGRCRRMAPTMKGYPVVFASDWCGEHKRGSNPVRENKELESKQEFFRQALGPFSAAKEQEPANADTTERKHGHSKLVYNEETRTIDTVDPHPVTAQTPLPTDKEDLKECCFGLRTEIEEQKERLYGLISEHPAFKTLGANNLKGPLPNAWRAFRHLEDARMRLGKVVRALDGGKSVYKR